MLMAYGNGASPDGAPVQPGYVMPRRPRVRERMTDERFQAIVHNMVDDAENYVDESIAPSRIKAAEYFYGNPMGNEVPGRSSIVMTEVRDVVNSMLPGLMRVFTGAQSVVEFEPQGEDDVEFAEQATQYMDYVFMRDN